MRRHPVPKVGDTVVLNDWGLGQVFGEGSVRSLQHMKTLGMKITKIDRQSLTFPEPTYLSKWTTRKSTAS